MGGVAVQCLLLVGVDVADGNGGEVKLLEVDFDRHGDGVEGEDEQGALPENERHSREREDDPQQAA